MSELVDRLQAAADLLREAAEEIQFLHEQLGIATAFAEKLRQSNMAMMVAQQQKENNDAQ
ncbi:MAG: hypothetical protein WAO76_00380 [Georgfuchsia sp.]